MRIRFPGSPGRSSAPGCALLNLQISGVRGVGPRIAVSKGIAQARAKGGAGLWGIVQARAAGGAGLRAIGTVRIRSPLGRSSAPVCALLRFPMSGSSTPVCALLNNRMPGFRGIGPRAIVLSNTCIGKLCCLFPFLSSYRFRGHLAFFCEEAPSSGVGGPQFCAVCTMVAGAPMLTRAHACVQRATSEKDFV